MEELINKWQDKHNELLSEYNYRHRGSENSEAQQLLRSRMRDILEFISDLKSINTQTSSHDTGKERNII